MQLVFMHKGTVYIRYDRKSVTQHTNITAELLTTEISGVIHINVSKKQQKKPDGWMVFNPLYFIITINLFYTYKDFSHCLPLTVMHTFKFLCLRGAVASM